MSRIFKILGVEVFPDLELCVCAGFLTWKEGDSMVASMFLATADCIPLNFTGPGVQVLGF
jgi:hypothetical protein